jgi:Tol biopolymer transport system component
LKAILILVLLCLSGIQTVILAQDSPTLFAQDVVSTDLMETTASFTPDGKTVYFTRSDNRFTDNTIMFSMLKNGIWSQPEVASFSGVWRDSEPHVAIDGKRIFFVSNRPATPEGQPLMAESNGRKFPGANIWYCEKTEKDWSQPKRIEGPVNETAEIYNPSVARNGNLYFSARYPSKEPSVGYKIYRSVYEDGKYQQPERISFSDNKLNDMDPAIDPEERFLVFASNRPGAVAVSNLFISIKDKNGVWGAPVPLGEKASSSSGENAPSLGPDGKTLYFTSGKSLTPDVTFPKKKEIFAEAMKRIRETNSRSRNIWSIDLTPWLKDLVQN